MIWIALAVSVVLLLGWVIAEIFLAPPTWYEDTPPKYFNEEDRDGEHGEEVE